MTPSEYEKESARTECNQDDVMRWLGNKERRGEHAIQALHAIIGMTTELGELSTHIHNWIWYGREIDRTKVLLEMGDLLWYLAEGLRAMRSSFSEVMAMNIAKLRARYPDKFKDVPVRDERTEEEFACQVFNEGHQVPRHILVQYNKLGLEDLLIWLRYGKESGYIAARCSKEQEEHWAELLEALLRSKS